MIFDTARTNTIALDGASVRTAIYTAVNQIRIVLARVIYDEATTSHTGVQVRIGIYGAPNFFAFFITEINKSISETTVIPIGQNGILAANETLIVECDGGKAGTGAITIQVELEAWSG